MNQSRFSLPDVVVVLVLSVVALQLLIACAEEVSTFEHRAANATQIRDIHQGLITYAQMNGGLFAGISGATGKSVNDIKATDVNMYGMSSPTNKDISAAYSILLTNRLLEPSQIISPLDAELKKPAPALPVKHTVTHANFSYALLQFGANEGNEGRRDEWRDTGNSMAPVVADRASVINGNQGSTSPYTKDRSGDSTQWMGNVGWNDNHVTFEAQGIFDAQTIKFGSLLNDGADDLFRASDGAAVDANAMFSYR